MSTGEREEITAAAIARLAGVGRSAVTNWRRRYPDFPQPAGGSPASPTFDRDAVEEWLRKTGKADQLATAGRTDGGTLRVSPAEGLFRSVSDLLPRDLFARAVAALLPRSVATPRNGDGQAPVVIDPACAGAVLLTAVADRFGDRVRLAGQEIEEGAARIAEFNLSVNSHAAEFEVHAGDSFTDDQLAGYLGKASAVVCEPPFDRPEWPVAELTTDPRWEFGIPAPRDGELAWVQHCYAHLRRRGTAIVAVSQRTCVQPSGEHIRAALIRSGALRAVIALPKGLTSVPGTDVVLWVLRRPASEHAARYRYSERSAASRRMDRDPLYGGEHAPVRMIDLSGLADPADVPQEHAAWQTLLTGSDGADAVARSVERLELLDAGASLLPSRYAGSRAEVSAADLERVTGRLAALYTQVGQGLPRFPAPKEPARLAYVTLAELERVGALTIRARDDPPRAGNVLLRTQGRMPVVATDTPPGSGIAQVIEVDSSRLDPYFVALFLRGDVTALPVANTLGAVNRDDLRRCRIPRMPLSAQRRYGEAFRRLTELDEALAKLSDLAAKVIGQTIYALTAGAVAPEYELPERREENQ